MQSPSQAKSAQGEVSGSEGEWGIGGVCRRHGKRGALFYKRRCVAASTRAVGCGIGSARQDAHCGTGCITARGGFLGLANASEGVG